MCTCGSGKDSVFFAEIWMIQLNRRSVSDVLTRDFDTEDFFTLYVARTQ